MPIGSTEPALLFARQSQPYYAIAMPESPQSAELPAYAGISDSDFAFPEPVERTELWWSPLHYTGSTDYRTQ